MEETRIYKSKIDWILFMPMYIIIGILAPVIFFDKQWIILLLLILALLFVTYQLFTTQYTISKDTLTIKSGFITNKNINIHEILEISKSGDMISSPAASMDRIEIKYNPSSKILISPKDKQAFILHLRTINPGIKAE